MNKQELRKKIINLLEEAQEQYEWGGDEDIDGHLHPGFVDWVNLQDDISRCLDLFDSS